MRIRTSGLGQLFLIFSVLLSGCDSDIVERGSRYIERLKLGIVDRFSAKISANREELSILDFLPEPNYSANKDSGDKQQLVDGELVRPPMWVYKESVGWFGETPVIIEARRKSSEIASGKIRIHAGNGVYADSALPRQIDVYTNVANGTVVAGSYTERPGLALEDKRNYWLEVPVANLGNRIVIALHANSSHVNIDEIEFVPDSQGKRANTDPEILKIESLKDLRLNASARLRLNMDMLASDRSQSKDQWRKVFGRDNVVSWVADPWLHRIDILPPEQINTEIRGIQVDGVNNEYETFAVGLYSTGIGLHEVNISVDGLPEDSFELFQLEHILTSEGDVAFDPLVPLNQNSIKLQPGWPTLLWVKLDLRKFKPGSYSANLLVQPAADKSADFPINIEVSDASQLEPAPIQAKVWGYTSDQPIWSDPQKAVNDQIAHYVNVWTIHPENIPGLNLGGKLEDHKLERLLSDLKFYKGKGVTRLYSGWTLEKNPLGLSERNLEINAAYRKKFEQWLVAIKNTMSSAGYKSNEWELYPLDEPSGPGLVALVSISEVIRETLPTIGIYANPITTHTHPSSVEQLEALVGAVDTWQPMLSFAREKGAAFFETLDQPWGFYHNPPLPAKFAEPIADYRAQGWWAWQLGASSVGFWSYSDSTGSSVWDDFDGRRPDFSVVYEKTGKMVSSRRWEGFAEGIEDYRLLVGSGLAADKSVDLSTMDHTTIRRIRQQALEKLSP